MSGYRLLFLVAGLTLVALCPGFEITPAAATARDFSPSSRAISTASCMIAKWTFDNTISNTATPPPSGGSGSASIGSGTTAAVVLPAFPWISRAWSLSAWDGGSLAGAEAGNDYAEFEANTEGATDVTFGFTLRYAGSADKLAQVEYSVDGGATFLPYGGQITVPASTWNHWTYNNADFAGKPSLKVRLYGWSGSLGFLLDEVMIDKSCIAPTVTATPTGTPTPLAQATGTVTPSATPEDTSTPLATASPTPSTTPENTAVPAATATETPTPTATPLNTSTPTPTPTLEPTPSGTPTTASTRSVYLPTAIR